MQPQTSVRMEMEVSHLLTERIVSEDQIINEVWISGQGNISIDRVQTWQRCVRDNKY